MKHVYPLIRGVILLMALFFHHEVSAQCDCADGNPSQKIEHPYFMDTTQSSKVFFNFPKFPTALGQLMCVTLYDTITIIASPGIRNLDSTAAYFTSFQLTLANSVSGPSMSISDVNNTIYGPDSIQIYNTPGDTLNYGPDTVFNAVAKQRTITTSSDLTAYEGIGNVNFQFNKSGGLIPLLEGTEYSQSVRTKTWAHYRLVYAWCPTTSLATNITNFSAIRKSNTIQLEWNVTNEEKSNIYEIQVSYDGRNYVPVAQVASQYATEGAAAKYHYQYLPDQAAAGKLYVRIQQTDADGKSRYSAIRVVNLDANGPASLTTYPNPVSHKIALQFDRVLNGRFAVDIVNSAGQLLYQRTQQAVNTHIIQVTLTNQPPPGIYYLRAKDLSSGQLYTSKIVIAR